MSQDAGERWAAETNRVTLKECRERYLKALAVVEAARGARDSHRYLGAVVKSEFDKVEAALAAFDEVADK